MTAGGSSVVGSRDAMQRKNKHKEGRNYWQGGARGEPFDKDTEDLNIGWG